MSTNTPRFDCELSAAATSLPHDWARIVGSGHATLALRADWQRQLTRCRRELGFRYVRFHGLLSDDVGTLVREKDELIRSFFNADQICDFLLTIDVRPFVELSFMPTALASGGDTVFHYRGNVTPPNDYNAWETLIRNLTEHWVQRYGLEEVKRWFFEIWNEPNLRAFWTGSQRDYFRLYQHAARAIKGVSKSLHVGGPATAENAWIPEFLDFCEANDVPVDFVSTHHYPTDAFGKPGDDTISQLAQSRRSVLREQAEEARHQARGKPLYYTEWSSSSNPFDELHDQPYAAAFIVKTAMEGRGLAEGYSYWTFSDIFEENYFTSLPFHGGFGLLNIYGVPKPSYRAYELLHRLGNQILPVAGHHETVDVWITRREQCVTVLLNNWALPGHAIRTELVRLRLNGVQGIRSAYIERIDDDHANARQAWLEMGRPGSLLPRQVEALETASALVKVPTSFQTDHDSTVFELTVPPQGTALLTLELADPPAAKPPRSDREMLEALQRETFEYFTRELNPQNGLIADRSEPGSPASIAAVGLGLSVHAAAVERGLLSRAEAIARTLSALRFFLSSPQGPEPDATGYRGFYYHFLDMKTGRRAGHCELSTIDTALLIFGALSAGLYFDGADAEEREIRDLADALYRRIDWVWALNGAATVSHGWTPESGFLEASWNKGYNEALILYVLALGSPTFPITEEGYRAWTSTFERKTVYDIDYLYAGPLFIHQLSHIWIDFRGIRDNRNREVDFDYFENSRRATLVQKQYAVENPHAFAHYSKLGWGMTASNGPGPAVRVVDGIRREFYGYFARGAPFGPDDGTISPWAVVASLPFAPDAVCETIRHMVEQLARTNKQGRGFDASINPTFPVPGGDPNGWVSPFRFGLNEGPIILMIENHLSGLLWRLFRRCSHVVTGLRRAGFRNGWLDL